LFFTLKPRILERRRQRREVVGYARHSAAATGPRGDAQGAPLRLRLNNKQEAKTGPESRGHFFEKCVYISECGQCESAPPGNLTVNTEPLPGSLATVTSPPIMRASLRERARPSPVPP